MPQRAAGPRPDDRRLVRPRPDPADDGRRDRPQSSNIGTALAASQFTPEQLWAYLDKFGLGRRTDVGMPGETRGLLPPRRHLVDADAGPRSPSARALSVNALQMATAVNALANGGELVTPEPGPGPGRPPPAATRSAPTPPPAAGWSAPRRPAQTAQMMELVTTRDVGTAPGAGIAGYRVAGKTGTAQQVGGKCKCYDGGTRRLLRRLRPGRQPALHRLRRGQAAGERRQRWRHRRPGVPQDPELRAAEVRRRRRPAPPPSTLPIKWGRARREPIDSLEWCPS